MDRDITPSGAEVKYRWPSWAVMVLGLWLLLSPFTLAYTGVEAAVWNAVIVGFAILGVAGARAYVGVPAEYSWINVVLGLWLIVAPFALAFADVPWAAGNQIAVGILVAGLAAMSAAAGKIGAEPTFASAEPETEPEIEEEHKERTRRTRARGDQGRRPE